MIEKILKFMDACENICIVCHRNPDADAIGSLIALRELLEGLSQKKFSIGCVDEMTEGLMNLFGRRLDLELSIESFDGFIFVDCSSLDISGLNVQYLNGKKTLSIDHHGSHDGFSDINIVDANVSSTCEMIFDLFVESGIDPSIDCLQAIASGILFDTGGLTHSNTSSKTLRIISKIRSHGIDVEGLNKKLFKSYSINELKMFGLIFKRAKINENGVLSCVVERSEIEDAECCASEMKKAIDFLNQVQGIKLTLLGINENEGSVKFSMRTQSEDVDVSKIAQLFDGGGHIKAAGFKVEI